MPTIVLSGPHPVRRAICLAAGFTLCVVLLTAFAGCYAVGTPYQQRLAATEATAEALTQSVTLGMPSKQAEALIRSKGFTAEETGSAVLAYREVHELFNACSFHISFSYDMSLTVTDIGTPPRACGSL